MRKIWIEMKRIGWLLLMMVWACWSPAQSDVALESFGSAFLTGLVSKDIENLRPLMVSESDARATMADIDLAQADIDQEMAIFNEASGRMQANFQASFDLAMEAIKDFAVEDIAFVKIERERPSRHPNIEKCDLLLYFNVRKKKFFIDVDDCVHTVNGWGFTSKFEVLPVEPASKSKQD